MLAAARELGINLRDHGDGTVGIALDETVRLEDVDDLLRAFDDSAPKRVAASTLAATVAAPELPAPLRRTSAYLTHEVFRRHHSETEMLRYLHTLESRDLSLNTSMIALGSCTMKLNATAEMAGVTWPEIGRLHPFAPADQAEGYAVIFEELGKWLAEITGFVATFSCAICMSCLPCYAPYRAPRSGPAVLPPHCGFVTTCTKTTISSAELLIVH